MNDGYGTEVHVAIGTPKGMAGLPGKHGGNQPCGDGFDLRAHFSAGAQLREQVFGNDPDSPK